MAPRMRPILLRYDQGRRRVRHQDGVAVGPGILDENVPRSRRCRETGNRPEIARTPGKGPKWIP
jgi:hypothetical protein